MFFKPIKPISISLSPNTERDDILLSLKLLFQPWRWKKGKASGKLEEEFKKYQKAQHAVSFNSGRSAFFAILKSLDLQKNSEILLQAFTCNAVPNPILWAGFTPVYVDCDKDDFNIDLTNAKRKITKNSKVLIVQHTFGLPTNMDEVLKFCQENNLILIEDCAHALGAEFKGKKVGTFAKAAFFSFSRDKVISSVYGGMAVTNDDLLAQKIRKFQTDIGCPPAFWVLQQLLHPVLLNFIILPIYKFFDLGKIFLVFSQWTHILSKAVHWKEKRGKKPDYFPRALPNALAILASNQFKKLERFNSHREKIAALYCKKLQNTSFQLPEKFPERKNIFLRFTIKHKNAHQIIYDAWHKENILIGDWYTTPIAPDDTRLDKIKYKLGSCPKTEKLANMTLNLPTHINISEKNLQRITKFLEKWK